MAFPEEWATRFRPLPGIAGASAPGSILIEREESPETTASGLLWIPTRLREAVKAPVAMVRRSADPRAQPGDVVLVAEGAGRRVAFGDFKPIVFYLVTYDQLRLRFARVERYDRAPFNPETQEFELDPSLTVYREVMQDESVYRLHLDESILLQREDVVDQGLSNAIGDLRGMPR